MSKQIEISKNAASKKITVVREFDAPVDQVWKAWTESSLLDQWWAPKPWKAETKSMDFREGGKWLYCMVGPDGTRSWCRVDFKTIDPQNNFTASDCFCDENGNETSELPGMDWKNVFTETGSGTKVTV
jgi:uncharacterized protein YndB with AHSA1/START domain